MPNCLASLNAGCSSCRGEFSGQDGTFSSSLSCSFSFSLSKSSIQEFHFLEVLKVGFLLYESPFYGKFHIQCKYVVLNFLKQFISSSLGLYFHFQRVNWLDILLISLFPEGIQFTSDWNGSYTNNKFFLKMQNTKTNKNQQKKHFSALLYLPCLFPFALKSIKFGCLQTYILNIVKKTPNTKC